jgi:hypothetical protein
MALRIPTAADLLELWDAVRHLSMARRAAALFALAVPTLDAGAVADVPLGRRDATLLAWRAGLFGDQIEGLAHCPRCGETVEVGFSAKDLGIEADDETTGGGIIADACEVGEWQVGYRVPTCGDAIALADAPVADGHTLLARCVRMATRDGLPVGSDALPDAVLDALARGIAEADPHADVLLDVTCPACTHRWSPPLDVASYVWREVDAWARRLLQDVVVLARALGWAEADILAMTPQRRGDYLDLVAGCA